MGRLTRTTLSHVALGLGAVALVVLGAGCFAEKLTTQQALVQEAFAMCQSQGPSAKLDRVDRDGRFAVVGRETDSKRVHDCMVRYADSTKRSAGGSAGAGPPAGTPTAVAAPAAPTTSATAAPAAPIRVTPPPSAPLPGGAPSVAAPAAPVPSTSAPAAPKVEAAVASRLPGTWRGTLKLPPRASGEAEVSSPAMLRFVVAAGSIQWSLASGTTASPLNVDGTAIIVDGEVRMTGTVRGDPARPNITVRYAGAMVGDRLEVTGVTTDRQVHVLSIRRMGE